jgi:hypothetical protein
LFIPALFAIVFLPFNSSSLDFTSHTPHNGFNSTVELKPLADTSNRSEATMTYVLEIQENGTLTLPPETLGNPKPRTRYVLETQGQRVTIQPEAAKPAPSTSAEEWLTALQSLAQAISQNSTSDRSALDILSEMRR